MSDLQEQIDLRSQEISTDSYSMSINEMASMYESDDLEVHPEFQRIFRWTIEQQSRLIESILLGIPVPPIFVAQREDGVWDVVDGVQRLSTILRFMGVLHTENDQLDPPEPLVEAEYLDALAGACWDDEAKDSIDAQSRTRARGVYTLSEAQRRIFKRKRIDFQIVEKESDDQAKFDLFQRLNSGTRLSEQEARNCLAVMLDASFSRWMHQLSEYAPYDETIDLSARQEQRAYGVETALRFLAIVNTDTDELFSMGDVGEFLTDTMRDFIEDESFDRDSEQARFNDVFSWLYTAVGSDAFRRWDPNRERHSGAFSISAFEAITSGLARHHSTWKDKDEDERSELIRTKIRDVWASDKFVQRAGGGKVANRRIPYMVEVGDEVFG